jgi:hypothetical protein
MLCHISGTPLFYLETVNNSTTGARKHRFSVAVEINAFCHSLANCQQPFFTLYTFIQSHSNIVLL